MFVCVCVCVCVFVFEREYKITLYRIQRTYINNMDVHNPHL